jgi:hypothetical protein
MNREQFWTLIEGARRESADAPEEGLRVALGPLSAVELVSFQRHFDELVGAAYHWKLWGAAYLMDGGCSDDGFIDFRYGLISLGRSVYDAVLVDPDSLVTVDDEIPNESFGYVASELYSQMEEGEMERSGAHPPEPIGEEWDFDDEAENQRRLPKLHAQFGNAA